METNENTYSAAKLREYVTGEIKENNDLHKHTALVDPDSKAQSMLSFLEAVGAEDSRAAGVVRRSAASRNIGKSVDDRASYAVGMTENEVEISPARAFSKMQKSILNNGTPYTALIFGGMNTGKTSLALLYLELWREIASQKYASSLNPVVISNVASFDAADYCVQSVSEFKTHVFGTDGWFQSDGQNGEPPIIPPEQPVFFLFDEASTHLDSHTNGYEVTSEYTPLLKRFAKVNTDAVHLGHSGMDIHKELRRPTITTEFIFKREQKVADVFDTMEDDKGDDKKYTLTGIPDTSLDFDPDDLSPWTWD